MDRLSDIGLPMPRWRPVRWHRPTPQARENALRHPGTERSRPYSIGKHPYF
jgi:hypothetical protein